MKVAKELIATVKRFIVELPVANVIQYHGNLQKYLHFLRVNYCKKLFDSKVVVIPLFWVIKQCCGNLLSFQDDGKTFSKHKMTVLP